MKKSTKAALYSALLFPGVGLLLLKQYKRAAIFILPAALITFYILREAMNIAHILADKITSGILPMDIAIITAEVTRMEQQLKVQLSDAIWLLIICWALSIFSSYFVGKKLETKTEV